MACCILAALIFAHFMAMVRRWGVFWGLVRPDEYDSPDTALRRLRGFLARPRVRIVAGGLLALEIAALSAWAWTAHGTHFYRLADEMLGKVHGQTIVYNDMCGSNESAVAVRMAFDAHGRLLSTSVSRGLT